MRQTQTFLMALILLCLVGSTRAEAALSQTCQRFPVVGQPPGGGVVLSATAPQLGEPNLSAVGVEGLTVRHSRVGALKISISHLPRADSSAGAPVQASTVVLKDVGAGGPQGVDIVDASFMSGPSAVEFPVMGAGPFSGVYKPAEALDKLVGGDSSGTWVLRVADLGADRATRTLDLESWTLVLCPLGATHPDALADAPIDAPSSTAPEVDREPVPAATPAPTEAPLPAEAVAPVVAPPSTPALTPAALVPLIATVSAFAGPDIGSEPSSPSASEQPQPPRTAGQDEEARALERLLGRLNRVANEEADSNATAMFDGPQASRLADGVLGRRGPREPAAVNSTDDQDIRMFQRLVDRLDELLAEDDDGGDGVLLGRVGGGFFRTSTGEELNSTTTMQLLDAVATNTTDFRGVFADGWLMPQSPFVQFLASLRDMVSFSSLDFSGGQGLLQDGTPTSAPPTSTVDRFLGGGGILRDGVVSSAGSSLEGREHRVLALTGFAEGAAGAQAVQAERPLLVDWDAQWANGSVASLVKRVASGGVDAATNVLDTMRQSVAGARSAVDSARDAGSERRNNRVEAVSETSDALRAALARAIDTRANAVEAARDRMASNIRRYSDSLIADARAAQEAAAGLMERFGGTRMSAATATTLSQELGAVFRVGQVLQETGNSLWEGAGGIASALVGSWRQQAEAARNALSMSADKGSTDRARSRSDSIIINSLNEMVGRVVTALDARLQGAGPLSGMALEQYKVGLQFLQGALAQMRTAVLRGDAVDTTGNAGSQQLLANAELLAGAMARSFA